MSRVATIRFRLTAAYALIMTIMVTATAALSWIAARSSLAVSVDRSLERDLDLFQTSLQIHLRRTELVPAIRQASMIGLRDNLLRVFDEQGGLVYQSPSLENNFSAPPPAVETGRITFRTVRNDQEEHVRLAATAIAIDSRRYTAELVQPLTVGERSLVRFGRLLMLGIPIALILASLGGYWLSGRALAPVEQIAHDARRISAENLSDRLAVPRANDELRRLSETLNAMLGRIDHSVSQLRQFTADASHELRAPLALIHTAAEFSLRRESPREELVDAMQKILRESKHTANLVDNLLLLARSDSGEDRSSTLVPLNLSSLCKDAADQANALASEKGIAVSTNLGSTSVVVDGDETALRRLLLVLVDNAIKYSLPGAAVNLRLVVEHHNAVIAVSDTGIGIAPDDVERVFDRFWRADKVRSRAAGGSGLGLAIARWIVERHHGSIRVSSELAKGSTFTVELPLSSPLPESDTSAVSPLLG